jgi:predicted molibdopterin-dependent oxidoreductase YjgC
MNWYSNIRDRCRGNGSWSACLNAVHDRRDQMRTLAEAKAKEKGHVLSPFNVMNMAQCVKCGRWLHCPNVMAETSANDIIGAAFDYPCDSHLEGGYTHPRDKYPEAPAAYRTLI